MPKKFSGENTKATAARARKEAVKVSKEETKKKLEEDEYWRDDNKDAIRKLKKKEEAERKRVEDQKRKEENRIAYEKEMNVLKTNVPVVKNVKVTQAMINAKKNAEEEGQKLLEKEQDLKRNKIQVESTMEENVNLIEVDGLIARSVVDAIQILSVDTPEIDRHPEKRMKAAYQDFEAQRMPSLKDENPTLRLSQLKQLLKKEWQKSPKNPLNQRLLLSKQ